MTAIGFSQGLFEVGQVVEEHITSDSVDLVLEVII